MNQPSQTLRQQVLDRVEYCLTLTGQKLDREFSFPVVNFNQRGRIAGSAWLERWELRFNPVLLADNETDFMTDIIPHEVAHLVAFACYGKVRPHGKEWQHIMQSVFGLQPHTRHRLDTAKVAPTFGYQCDCRQHRLSQRRHNNIQRGKQRYQCLHCNTLLSLSKI
ncbi:SprT family zinc-dependent metalloprotease [Oceanisphaera psychrotolerans]|uniref:SprT family protein n=1 Tax=Oceanisphaera psychrotolerans TaxID=1414654 RepID=A0A1J4QGL9_9GAMM|nr:SprT family zinc-dependent metalloprotease [Oceanisphaera psychrotolerans]OIN09228.1 SprT family protein [Oceanisphaera psychrotolerans]